MAKLGQYNLEDMTAMQVIEAARSHLLNQGVKSMNKEGDCLYKGKKSCCAAAIFIQNYTPAMEGTQWDTLIAHHKQTSTHKDLVQDLQEIHDNYEVEQWKAELDELENVYLNRS